MRLSRLCGSLLELRNVSQLSTMAAWQVHDFTSEPELNQISIPVISSPNEVLVKVRAASINPIDIRMKIVGLIRKGRNLLEGRKEPDLPLVLGRDFSGTVVDVGKDVAKFKPGDEVFGTVPAEKKGAFAENVMTKDDWICLKPKDLSHTDAASLPYVAITCISALGMAFRTPKSFRDAKILVHGGSGGIGTFFIQYARAHGAQVCATCSGDTMDLVKSLGANTTVDYTADDAFERLRNAGPFDLILDPICSSLSIQSGELLGIWRNSVYITLTSPFLKDTDDVGLPLGLVRSLGKFASQSFKLGSYGRHCVWGFYTPIGAGKTLTEVANLVTAGKLKPVVEKVFNPRDIGELLKGEGARDRKGKYVVSMENGF